jgi:hypothetical protein
MEKSSTTEQPVALPAKNADGLDVIPLTDEQRYTFDLNGWLLVPNVLSKDQVEEMREFCHLLKKEPEKVSEKDGSSIGGPLEALTDHPFAVGFMQEFLSNPRFASETVYGFRFELTFMAYRFGELANDNWNPHGGGGGGMPTSRDWFSTHSYLSMHRKAYCGLTQIVWELNPVRKGDGTHFLSGSHKSCFGYPDAVREDKNHPLWDTYECDAGSAIVFTESLGHSGAVWSNQEWDRVAIFNSYNSVDCKYHDWEPHPEHLAEMPEQRKTLFRDVRSEMNVPSAEYYSQREKMRTPPEDGKSGGRGVWMHPEYRPIGE